LGRGIREFKDGVKEPEAKKTEKPNE
jgi:Sec-independent protein translocase protein TatA